MRGSTARHKTAGPRPLKIEAADTAVDIQDFTRKKKPGADSAFQRVKANFTQRHAAGSSLESPAV